MNFYPLLALVAFAYAGVVWFVVIKQPPKYMKLAKLEAFQNMMGKTAANIFYYVWGTIAAGLGIFFLTLA